MDTLFYSLVDFVFASLDRFLIIVLAIWLWYQSLELSILSMKYTQLNEALERYISSVKGTDLLETSLTESKLEKVEDSPVFESTSNSEPSITELLLPSMDQEKQSESILSQNIQKIESDRIAQPDWLDNVIDWFKVDRPMKIGGLLLLIGFGWFVMYAIEHNWISPLMRVVATGLVGVGFVIFGGYKIKSYPVQSSYLIGLGASIYVVAIFLGLKVFELYSVLVAMILIFAQYLILLFLSYRHQNNWIGGVGLFYSLLAPIIFSDGTGNITLLFTYLSINILGALVIAWLNHTEVSRLLAVIYVAVYTVLCFTEVTSSFVLLIFVVGLSLLIGGLEVCPLFFSDKNDRLSLMRLTILALSILLTFVVLMFALPIDEIAVTIMIGCISLILMRLWIHYSVGRIQDGYSAIVGFGAIAMMIGLLFYHLTGFGLVLGLVLVWGFVLSVVLVVTKSVNLVSILYWGFIVPLVLVILQDISTLSSLGVVLVSLYGIVAISGGLMRAIHRYYDAKAVGTFFAFSLMAVCVWIYTLTLQFDGYATLIALMVMSLVIAMVALSYRVSYRFLLGYSLIPLGYVLCSLIIEYHWSVNVVLALIIVGLMGIGIGLHCLAKYTTFEVKDEDYRYIPILWIVGLAYLLVGFAVQTGQTFAWLTISVTVYWLGVRMFPFWGAKKLSYLGLFSIPLISTFGFVNLNPRWITFTSLAFASVALWLDYDTRDEYQPHHTRLAYLYHGIALLFVGVGLYVPVENYVSYEMSIVTLLVVFAIIGLWYYSYGKTRDHDLYRSIGTIILAVVVGRLLMVELRTMTLLTRIIVLLMIGGLMLVSGFLGKKKK